MNLNLTPNPELRASARAVLRGKWALAVVATIVYLTIVIGITEVLHLTPGLSYETTTVGLDSFSAIMIEPLKATYYSPSYYISLLIILPITFGYTISFLSSARSGSEVKIDELFVGFKTYGKVLGTMLLMQIYICLWSLLLLIPGVIKTYSYAMVPYLLKDEPELSADETIMKSMAMMKGNKMKLFLLDLSFIGWILLSILTVGIGLLWVLPYTMSARAAFYEDLKNAQQPQTVEAV